MAESVFGKQAVLPAKAKLEYANEEKKYNKLLDKADELFDKETLKDAKRTEEAKQCLLRYKAIIESITPRGCFVMNLTFLQPCDVDDFYHDHFRVGPGSLSAALSDLLITDEMRAVVGGEELMVRVEVRYDDYIRVRRRLCTTGLQRSTSVDDLSVMLLPPKETEIRPVLNSLDLATNGSRDSSFTHRVTEICTKQLTLKMKKMSQALTGLEAKHEIAQRQVELQEGMVKGLQREVTRLTQEQDTAQKRLLNTKREKKEVTESNETMEESIKELTAEKTKLTDRLVGLEAKHEIAQRQVELQEGMVRSLQREVTRLTQEQEIAQRLLLDNKKEIEDLTAANKGMKDTIEELLAEKTKLTNKLAMMEREEELKGEKVESLQRDVTRLTQEKETTEKLLLNNKKEIADMTGANKAMEETNADLLAEKTKLSNKLTMMEKQLLPRWRAAMDARSVPILARNTSSQYTITSEGGTLEEDGVNISFPMGCVETERTLSLEAHLMPATNTLIKDVLATTPVLTVYAEKAEDFLEPVTVTLPWAWKKSESSLGRTFLIEQTLHHHQWLLSRTEFRETEDAVTFTTIQVGSFVIVKYSAHDGESASPLEAFQAYSNKEAFQNAFQTCWNRYTEDKVLLIINPNEATTDNNNIHLMCVHKDEYDPADFFRSANMRPLPPFQQRVVMGREEMIEARFDEEGEVIGHPLDVSGGIIFVFPPANCNRFSVKLILNPRISLQRKNIHSGTVHFKILSESGEPVTDPGRRIPSAHVYLSSDKDDLEMGATGTGLGPSTMDTTSEKHRCFVGELIVDKPTAAIPGIGEKIAANLEAKGIIKAKQIMGQFLTKDGNELEFKNWVESFGANTKQQQAIYNAVKEWCDNNT